MSKSQLNKYNLKSIRECADGLYIISKDTDEWILRQDNTLLHRNSRGKGNIEFHKQLNTNGLYHALGYIAGHSRRLTRKQFKMTKMEYLYSLI